MTDTVITLPRSVVEQAIKLLDALSYDENYDYDGCFQHWTDYARPENLALQFRAALEQPDIEIPASVPEGWKLVPVEPTDDMLYDIQEYSHILPPRGRRIWAHMLAAAPQPPALEQPQPKREPIPSVMMDLGWELHGSNDAYQTWCMAVEWTELCHGIGGKK